MVPGRSRAWQALIESRASPFSDLLNSDTIINDHFLHGPYIISNVSARLTPKHMQPMVPANRYYGLTGEEAHLREIVKTVFISEP